jgi:hypothetical protein
MERFAFAYRTPSEVAQARAEAGSYTAAPETLAAWQAWLAEMGASVGDASPVFARSTLGETGVDTALAGYTIIEADDLEAAVALAKGRPVLHQGGGVDVVELTIVNAT